MRRLARTLEGHPRLRLGALLAPPLGWLGVLYLGSLALLFAAAFWHYDSDITFTVTKTFTLENFAQLLSDPIYRSIAARTILIAVLVTVLAAQFTTAIGQASCAPSPAVLISQPS